MFVCLLYGSYLKHAGAMYRSVNGLDLLGNTQVQSLTTTGATQVGLLGTPLYRIRSGILICPVSSVWAISKPCEPTDSITNGALVAQTLFSYVTQRLSVTYNFTTPFASSNYHVLAWASDASGAQYVVTTALKTTTTIRFNCVRGDSNTISNPQLTLSFITIEQ